MQAGHGFEQGLVQGHVEGVIAWAGLKQVPGIRVHRSVGRGRYWQPANFTKL